MPRPKFVPTKDQRLTVKTLSAYGINQEGIARKIGLRSPKSLRKHFREELALGAIEALAQVSQTHYQMAKSGKFPASTMHFLNTRARWLDLQSFSPVDDESKDAEKRTISRIVWRTAEQPKENSLRKGIIIPRRWRPPLIPRMRGKNKKLGPKRSWQLRT